MKTTEFEDVFLSGRPLQSGVVLERKNQQVFTNVPHRLMHHAAGYNWGYNGSGPAELALNILENYAYRLNKPNGGKVSCFDGSCTRLAWNLHQKFKVEFLQNFPKSGGVIPAQKIIDWIDENWDGIP